MGAVQLSETLGSTAYWYGVKKFHSSKEKLRKFTISAIRISIDKDTTEVEVGILGGNPKSNCGFIYADCSDVFETMEELVEYTEAELVGKPYTKRKAKKLNSIDLPYVIGQTVYTINNERVVPRKIVSIKVQCTLRKGKTRIEHWYNIGTSGHYTREVFETEASAVNKFIKKHS